MYLHLFDRSDLDEVVAIDPRVTPARVITRRQDLAESKYYHRSDVVLMNCTNTGREYLLYVTADGFSGDLFLLDVLSADQYAELMIFAAKMRSNALEYAPATKLLSK